jgi:hypothetical protein
MGPHSLLCNGYWQTEEGQAYEADHSPPSIAEVREVGIVPLILLLGA